MPLLTEEGRVKLRKASGSCKRATIRWYPNGGTRLAEGQSSYFGKRGTRRTETSKYPEEKKTKVISQVAASEREEAQTAEMRGCRICIKRKLLNQKAMESAARDGESPVRERQ